MVEGPTSLQPQAGEDSVNGMMVFTLQRSHGFTSKGRRFKVRMNVLLLFRTPDYVSTVRCNHLSSLHEPRLLIFDMVSYLPRWPNVCNLDEMELAF